jgi:hypothetical protein
MLGRLEKNTLEWKKKVYFNYIYNKGFDIDLLV